MIKQLICLSMLASTISLSAQAPGFQAIQSSGAVGNSSPGILANGTLYVSGQGSRKQEFTAQVEDALHNVQSVLRGAGMDFGNVVWMNIYLTDNHNLPAMNEIYWKTIGANPPARTVLTVAALPDGQQIQINCIAVADTAQRKAIWPAGWPHGDKQDPPAVQAGELLYLSAQGGQDPLTGTLRPNFTEETKQALDNVSTILAAAHMSMKNVVWVNPYFSKGGQYDVMGRVYKSYFEFGNTPGRGTIQVMGLPNQEHIVFSCIAGADLSKRKAVRPRNMPPSPTASPGVLYGDTLYLSAKDGFIPDQGMVTPLFDLQLRQSMRNLLDGLQEVDMDFSNVVFSTVYLRQMKDNSQMDPLYGKFFKEPFPARSILQQNLEVDEEAAEQISFIAVKK
jgi:enamine deaminase RidA (YjgF/YER057c/UK114 family)